MQSNGNSTSQSSKTKQPENSNSSSKKNRPSSTPSTSTSSRGKKYERTRRKKKSKIIKRGSRTLEEKRNKTVEDETQRTESIHKKLLVASNDDRTFEDVTQSSIYKKPALDRDKATTQLQKQQFIDFARTALSKGVKGILNEYTNELVPYTPTGITRKAFEANPKKNRYTDVICIDQTRIILRNQSPDYIHANIVRGGPLLNVFICTQGPVKETVKDFWKMIVQEQVGNIVMLCDIMESGKLKCQQYWPPKEGNAIDWGGIVVKNVDVDTATDVITVISTLEVTVDRRDKFVVKHHHWKSWPDKSVPKSYLAPFRVLKNVRHSSKPTVVHCSAGIGRTGSIVALEVCYQQMLSEQSLSVLDMVKWLRKQRWNAVQTDTQYLYLFKCLISLSSKCNYLPQDLSAKIKKFDEEYQRLIDEKENKKKFKREIDIEYTE
uniref:Uncharacterized protein n=1 Tax=Panagrolaimus sp. ES5 TaxID=591445 RepID=A0AC34FGV5_9BILA